MAFESGCGVESEERLPNLPVRIQSSGEKLSGWRDDWECRL
jgi:hypothetical protein